MSDEKPCQDLALTEGAETICDSREGTHFGVVRDPPSSGPLVESFSTPFNWCDRRCERCPLAEECLLSRREAQRRWLHEMRGEDSDSMAVAMSDVEEELARALALARAIAHEEGIDLDAPLPPMPISLEGVKLRRAGLDLTVALHAVLESDGAELPPAPSRAIEDAYTASLTLAAKCARIASYLSDRHDDAWAADAVPNLLLMERLRARFDDALASIEAVLNAERLAAVRAAPRSRSHPRSALWLHPPDSAPPAGGPHGASRGTVAVLDRGAPGES